MSDGSTDSPPPVIKPSEDHDADTFEDNVNISAESTGGNGNMNDDCEAAAVAPVMKSRSLATEQTGDSNHVYDLGAAPRKEPFGFFTKKGRAIAKVPVLPKRNIPVPDAEDEESGQDNDVYSEIRALNTKIVQLEMSHQGEIEGLRQQNARERQQNAREIEGLRKRINASQRQMAAFLNASNTSKSTTNSTIDDVVPHGAEEESESSPNLPGESPDGDGNGNNKQRGGGGFSFFRTYDKFVSPNEEEGEVFLDNDTFTLMMVSNVRSQAWALGILSYLFEMILGSLIALDQINLSDGSSVFDVPFNVNTVVRVGQFFSIFLCLSTQTDMLTSVQSLVILGKGSKWDVAIGEPNKKSARLWITRILFPNLLKFSQGLLVMFVSFVIIVQSDNIIDLLKDFTALMVLSETDNILFHLATQGFLGRTLVRQTASSTDRSVDVSQQSNSLHHVMPLGSVSPRRGKRCRCLNFRPLILAGLFAPMLGGWIGIIRNQINGTYFRDKYPRCNFTGAFELAKEHFGDGTCYGGPLNSLDCEFEDGDCVNFNLAYPLCKGRDDLINVQDKVNDGACDSLFIIPECDYDGGDCCPYSITNSPEFGDGQCHGGRIGTYECGLDSGDCNDFNRRYPNCPYTQLDELQKVTVVGDVVLGNGVCESGIYSFEDCGYEDSDCDPGQLGQDIKIVTSPIPDDSPFSDSLASFSIGTLSRDGKTLVTSDGRGTASSGLVKAYRYHDSFKVWMSLGDALSGDPPSGVMGSGFGDSLSVDQSGNRIAIGIPLHNYGNGQAKVFEYDASTNKWKQIGQALTSDRLFGQFGTRLDLSQDGSRLAVTEPDPPFAFVNGQKGWTYIYEWNGSTSLWELLGNAIIGGVEEADGSYAAKLSSLDGNTVLLSAGYRKKDMANMYVKVFRYHKDAQDWSQLGGAIQTPDIGDTAISADGNRIAIAVNATVPNTNGAVQVFDFDEDNESWNQVGKTLYSPHRDPLERAGFGRSVAMSNDGNILSVSSINPNCDGQPFLCATGEVYFYTFIKDGFLEMISKYKDFGGMNRFAKRENDRTNSIFGFGVSISGDGSVASIRGYDLRNDEGFVRLHDLNEWFSTKCGVDEIKKYDDGSCDDEFPLNSEACDFDAGQCRKPTEKAGMPGCWVTYPDRIGDGRCEVKNLEMYNTTECEYDGGDCLGN